MITIDAKEVNFYYGDFHALKNITMEMERNTVTAFIGPSGCGKSTFLRLLNRMNDLIPGTRLTGEILIDDENIYARQTEVVELRKKVGMVFQKPNPFPKSIFENVAYGLRVSADRRARRTLFTGRGPLERSERQTKKIGFRTLRGPATAALHRPGPGRRTVDPADG